MENRIIDRIITYIKYKKLSERSFSLSIGASSAYINTLKKDKSNIGGDMMERILDTYPEINGHWLITGKGEMIYGEAESPKSIDEMIEEKIEAKLNSQGYTFEDYETIHKMRKFVLEQMAEAERVAKKQKNSR
ncbi:hypothetical protein [uncultured Aquimarina sp.]|uniref:hypothetical protein n=1 Tax=uncultured Aquimarina sp. TaxID=575652 RepID=UPI00261C023A|nr:hypothetical protein [uncultured Aquimarina sp.]